MKMDMVNEALQLFKQGLKPIPLAGKKPLIQGWPTLYEINDISETDIEKGFLQNGKMIPFSNNNIGVLTGAISNTIVIDLDSEDAVEWFKQQGKIRRTWLAKTRRGYHIYFNYQKGIKSTKLHQKIDILSDKRFVVAPPSIHPEGTTYEWIHNPWDTTKEDLPKWLHTLISPVHSHTHKLYNKVKNKKRNHTTKPINWFDLYSRTVSNIRGTGLWRNGRCPFHSDRHNSFGFHIRDGGYKCFAGCGSGSGLQFIQRIYSIPYHLALRLANGEDVYIG
ncbi:bifunctional DNA primase/polymerase [Fictibacillus sp. 18YEL24]|nr:bifunctional DNA primase/polymerase [Fictibacillus sp. 18YEL24]